MVFEGKKGDEGSRAHLGKSKKLGRRGQILRYFVYVLKHLDFILKMLGYHLKILGKVMFGVVVGFEEYFGSIVEYGLEVEYLERP